MKPTQNAYTEGFNGRVRDECLNEHRVSTLAEARAIIEDWRCDYNQTRLHRALNNRTPEEFVREFKNVFDRSHCGIAQGYSSPPSRTGGRRLLFGEKLTVPDRFFVLGASHDDDRSFASRDESRIVWKERSCGIYGVLPERRESILAVKDVPSTADDILWTWMGDALLNDRARLAFMTYEVSGCRFLPVALPVSPMERPSHQLWELRITGFAGFATAERGVTIRSRCDECGAYSFSFHEAFSRLLDVEKWDGTDLFRLWPFSAVICTEKVRSVMTVTDISGAAVMPIEDYDVPNGDAAPGLPSEWLTPSAMDRLYSDADYILALRKP